MRRTLLLTAGLALLALAWCDGSRRGHESAEADHYRILRAPIVESLHVLVPMLRVDTVRIRSALSRAESLRIAARLAIATYENAKPADTLSASTGRDTASRDDHITPPAVSPVVGTSTIPRVVAACQDALTSDSAAIATLTVSLDHCGRTGDCKPSAPISPSMSWRTNAVGIGSDSKPGSRSACRYLSCSFTFSNRRLIMASLVYAVGLLGLLNHSIDFASDNIDVILCKDTYTPTKDDTNSVIAAAELDDLTGYDAGYGGSGRKALASKAVSNDATNDGIKFDAADPSAWTIATGDTVGGAMIVKRGTSNDTTAVPLFFLDLTDTPSNGAAITVSFGADGIARIPYGAA